MKHIKLFEEFLLEADSGAIYPPQSAGDWLKKEVGSKLSAEEKNFAPAIKSLNRYNSSTKVKSISEMELVYMADAPPSKYQWDMPATRIDTSDPIFASVLWDAYTLGRWNGRPGILFEKNEGLDHRFYVFAVPN